MKILYTDWELNDKDFCEVCGKEEWLHSLAVIRKTAGRFTVQTRVCSDHVDGSTTPWTLDAGAKHVENTIKDIAQILEKLDEQLPQSLSGKAKTEVEA